MSNIVPGRAGSGICTCIFTCVITCVFTCVDQKLYYVPLMKCRVRLFVAGQIIQEEMVCRDYEHAREIALARNPSTQILDVTAILAFDKEIGHGV